MGKYDNVNDVRYFAYNASIRIWIFEERSEGDFQIFALRLFFVLYLYLCFGREDSSFAYLEKEFIDAGEP